MVKVLAQASNKMSLNYFLNNLL